MRQDAFDLIVIGGGINGTGIARDAAGRGLSVALLEGGDLGAGTSSASSRLIHGGLRYLENYQFRLVRQSLIEREILLKAAPHLVRPLRFVLPHSGTLRPPRLVRAGLFLYDRLAGTSGLPRSEAIALDDGPFGRPLQPACTGGFVYSDCWGDDSRLVVANAIDAAQRGAAIKARTLFTGARPADGVGGGWEVTATDGASGAALSLHARALVNAAGPWARALHAAQAGPETTPGLRLVKGSHIIVPRLYEGEHCYILQHEDQRVVLVMPYEGFTLIGTTDIPVAEPAATQVDPAEVAYLCAAVNRYFRTAIGPEMVLWGYAGVRPLFDDGLSEASRVTREAMLVEGGGDGPPLLSVFGGKITTYRHLAETAMDRLSHRFPGSGGAWTAGATLPGGDVGTGGLAGLIADAHRRWPWLPQGLVRRYAQAYGSRMTMIVGDATHLFDFGRDYGGGLFEAEVDYLIAHEFARTARDILWRRSKLGLHLNFAAHAGLAAALAAQGLGPARWEHEAHPMRLEAPGSGVSA